MNTILPLLKVSWMFWFLFGYGLVWTFCHPFKSVTGGSTKKQKRDENTESEGQKINKSPTLTHLLSQVRDSE